MIEDLRHSGPVEWLEFHHPETGTPTAVNLSFLTSNWKCLYSIGCPGCISENAKQTLPDLGCCTHGFYLTDDEQKSGVIDKRLKKLTRKDWDDELRAEYQRRGTWTTAKGDKALVVKGGCIFANRAGGSAGKPGCAFLHLGNRLNDSGEAIYDNSEEHVQYMPEVCSQLPLYAYWDDNGGMVITAWSSDMWTGGESGQHPHKFWCVDSVDAYINIHPLYVTMERELRRLLGDVAYEMVRQVIESKRDANGESTVAPWPVSAEGRNMLRMLNQPEPPEQTISQTTGHLTPKRPMP